VTPSSVAPRSIIWRSTPAANCFSFHFFLTDLTFTSAKRFDGRTRATAMIRPVSSSTA